VALHNHHDCFRRFPSGGWGWNWAGMPDRGTGAEQPGGWLYSVLPFTENGELRSRGVGGVSPQIEQAILQVLATPVSLFNCPSRRNGGPYPNNKGMILVGMGNGNTTFVNPVQLARCDYGGNAGSQGFNQAAGPNSLLQAKSATFPWPNTSKCTGIFFQRSTVTLSDVLRGNSNTFLAGERYVDPGHYDDGLDNGDNEAMYVGFDNDVNRVTANPPRRDQLGIQAIHSFGSAHGSGLNMLYCDGSARLVNYDIDPDLFFDAGSRY
jgi:prepilin-type processing-associated H-X9-DG protein